MDREGIDSARGEGCRNKQDEAVLMVLPICPEEERESGFPAGCGAVVACGDRTGPAWRVKPCTAEAKTRGARLWRMTCISFRVSSSKYALCCSLII